MVARITIPKSLRRALNYNEQKMQKGQAECIHAHNFLKEAGQLNFYEKLQRFEHLIALNKRAATNTLHVSLNFDPSERFEKEKLAEIATIYMEKIGFADQPFLVYEHHDAGHPHIHILTTAIRRDGSRISLHNIGRNESMKARREIEQLYNLVRAEKQTPKVQEEIKPVNVMRVVYGGSETKRSITNVLDAVIDHYKFTSLAELNAVLKLYNVIADRGKEDGIIFKKRGLVYRILDERGNKIGVPIKASSVYSKPTLSNLEKKFEQNEVLRQEHKKSIRTSIDWIMLKHPDGLEAFCRLLQKEKISLVIRRNETVVVYGMTYIDHRTKCVFNGSDLGKMYSAKMILERCRKQNLATTPSLADEKKGLQQQDALSWHPSAAPTQQTKANSIDRVIEPGISPEYIPYQLIKKKKKKKRFNL